jgi:organic radical activating enzyme
VNLKVSEVFDSVQGEGASTGKAASFLRLALCNLRCRFCDTSYTWDFERHDRAREVHIRSVDALAARLQEPTGHRLIVTGGEPLLQQSGLAALFERLPRSILIEIETNGTLLPEDPLISRVNQWNVSPKLSNGGDPEARRLRFDTLQRFREMETSWLKLVVDDDASLLEASSLIEKTAWPKSRVLFMPLASNRAELRQRSPWVDQQARLHGVRFSNRLHLELWDGQRGV